MLQQNNITEISNPMPLGRTISISDVMGIEIENVYSARHRKLSSTTSEVRKGKVVKNIYDPTFFLILKIVI